MNKQELKQKYFSDCAELRKIINYLDFIPGAPSDEFDTLSNKVLSHLYKGSEFEKILRVVSSELAVTYGLCISEVESQKLTEEITEWWRLKNCS